MKLGDGYILLIGGKAEKNDLELFNSMVNSSGIKNVHYIGFLSRAELRYLLRRCFINVSIFDMSCVNQIFCASGKVYEGLFEGVPVLTSENPSFKSLCSEYGVGIATSNYAAGIKKIINNYDYYKANVKNFVEVYPYEDRLDNYLREVLRRLKIVDGELL